MALKVYMYYQLALTLIFTAFQVESKCQMEIKESSKEIWLTEKESHNLPCDVSLTGQCPNVKFTWHVLKESSYEWLDLGSGSLKYSVMNQGALEVKSFDVSDSGIYYCGVAGNHKRIIGNGTVVTVTALSHQIRQALLWLLFAAIALYSLIVLALLILKMTGRDIPIQRLKCGKSNGSKNNSTRRRHFRAVLQELYSNRNLRVPAKTQGLRPSADSQFENPYTPAQDDDIYQNM